MEISKAPVFRRLKKGSAVRPEKNSNNKTDGYPGGGEGIALRGRGSSSSGSKSGS